LYSMGIITLRARPRPRPAAVPNRLVIREHLAGREIRVNARGMRLLTGLLLLAVAATATAADVYVSPSGNDAHSGGSAATAVKTLARARNLATSGDSVHAAAGTYTLSKPLVLGPEHAGVAWVADGGPVIVSGGATIGPWKPLQQHSATSSPSGSPSSGGSGGGGCSVKLMQKLSRSDCVEGKSFGCIGSSSFSSASVWIDGCRGKFECDGHQVTCSINGPGNHTCMCDGTPPPPPPPPPPLKIVTADVSFLGAGAQSRHLYVRGVRARRAQFPNAESLFTGSKLTAEGYTLRAGANGSSLRPGAEFVFPQSTSPWTEPRCAVASVAGTAVKMMQPCWTNLFHKACGQHVKGPPDGRNGYIENAGKEFVLSPGDFALDEDSKTVHYALREGEDAADLGAIMPVLEVLVEISSGGGGGDSSGHVSFEGFSFRHATWLRPGQEDGYVEQQCGACAVGTNENNHECDKVSQTLTMS
jgi:hypothetical protein